MQLDTVLTTYGPRRHSKLDVRRVGESDLIGGGSNSRSSLEEPLEVRLTCLMHHHKRVDWICRITSSHQS
jgi:hypothetical protein